MPEINLDPDQERRTIALENARFVLGTGSALNALPDLGEEAVIRVVVLAEYILKGEHPALEDDGPEPRPELDQAVQEDLDRRMRYYQPKVTVDGVTAALREQLTQDVTWDSLANAGAQAARSVIEQQDAFNREALGVAKIHPATHRQPLLHSTLIDREGDTWEWDEAHELWEIPGTKWAGRWHTLGEYAPFTIPGAPPSVADALGQWSPEWHPEPPRDRTLIDARGSEYTHDRGGWRRTRTAGGRSLYGLMPVRWAALKEQGPFTIKTEEGAR